MLMELRHDLYCNYNDLFSRKYILRMSFLNFNINYNLNLLIGIK